MADDELLDRLLELINSLGPNQRIPAERRLEEEWGVSRAALRHRLRLLEAMGTLERRGSAGTFTKTLQPADVALTLGVGLNAGALAEPSAFRGVRAALETEAALLAARNGRPVAVAHIEEAVLRMEETDDPEVLYEADLEFHRAVFMATNDPGLEFFHEALSEMFARSVAERRLRMATLAADVDIMRTLHRAILDAIREHDDNGAAKAMREHFDRIDELRPLILSREAAKD